MSTETQALGLCSAVRSRLEGLKKTYPELPGLDWNLDRAIHQLERIENLLQQDAAEQEVI